MSEPDVIEDISITRAVIMLETGYTWRPSKSEVIKELRRIYQTGKRAGIQEERTRIAAEKREGEMSG